MTMTADTLETDTHGRILTTAERLFREIGYQKTTVADIAKALRMSPANVYRFFDSKQAIHQGVAKRLMSEVETAAAAIATKPLPPVARLRELLAAIHFLNAERYVGDNKLHEMVAIAMEEDWEVCHAHIMRIEAIVGGVIADGVAAGDFRPGEAAATASCVCTSMLRFFHPQMIAQCKDKPEPTLDQMIDFVVEGLSAGASAPSRSL